MTSSIFHLKQKSNDMEATTEGVSNYRFHQIPASRNVSDNEFVKGNIYFRFGVSGRTWWVPSKSYLNIRYEIVKGDTGEQVTVSDDIGYAYNAGACMWRSGELRMNSRTVSQLSSAYYSQIDTLHKRMLASKGHLDTVMSAGNGLEVSKLRRALLSSSDVGLSENVGEHEILNVVGGANGILLDTTQNWDDNGTPRVIATLGVRLFGPSDINNQITIGGQNYNIVSVSVDGTTANLSVSRADFGPGNANEANWEFARRSPLVSEKRRMQTRQELNYQLPFSVMNVDHALPNAQYEINMQPNVDYELAMVEALVAGKVNGDEANQYRVRIKSIFLYACLIDGPSPMTDGTFYLDLLETDCQSRKNRGQLEQLTVPRSTVAITLAQQDQDAGRNSQHPPTMFRVEQDKHLQIADMYVKYADQTQPIPAFTDAKDGDTNDTGALRMYYYQNHLNKVDTMNHALSNESYEDWLVSPFFSFNFRKDGLNSTATQATVQMDPGANAENPPRNILVFAHYRSTVKVVLAGGRVIDVVKESV